MAFMMQIVSIRKPTRSLANPIWEPIGCVFHYAEGKPRLEFLKEALIQRMVAKVLPEGEIAEVFQALRRAREQREWKLTQPGAAKNLQLSTKLWAFGNEKTEERVFQNYVLDHHHLAVEAADGK